ncbi:protein disulfide-isomerase A4-like [Homarus americanus]|uniref:protein disulfide-isomerase A4-like n=1 Tax=Homarus americanus TaxID=6706 RepID=UPI001C48F678|nr:protein disulfide-isomerase A4-like [Homarus americanus]
MNYSLLLLLLLGICAGQIQQQEPKITIDPDGEIPVVEGFGGNIDIVEEDDVLVLTRDNFLHVVNSRDVILVEFYAPWCGHCKQLAPEYAAAATELKEEGISLGKVDATKEQELAKEHLVSGYPTIKLFKKGQPVEDYSGARDSRALVDYMRIHADPNYEPPPSAVVVLTTANFSKTVKSKDLILVEFYAPWCRHCKALEPDYEAAAKDLKEHSIPLAKVDATEEKEITDEYGVKGYPTLLVFRNGRQFEYKGKRDHSGIVDYMKEQARLPSREVQTALEAQNNFARTDANVIAYFSEKNDMFEEFIGAANELRGKLSFFHTFDDVTAEQLKLKVNTITIIMPEIYHSKYEDKVFRYNKATGTYREIAAWIEKKSIPLVGQRTMSNKEFKYAARPLVVIYYDVNFSHQYIKDTQYIRNKILPVADKNRDLLFVVSNEEEFEEELQSLGLEDSGESVNVAAFANNLKYPMDPEDEFSADVLSDFVDKLKSGKLTPHLKSQPVPKHQDGPVRVIVAKNFEQEVMLTKKDVLIEFYAPWCGHCKNLDPIYKKLAKQLSKINPDVVVAKMDATANDVYPLFKVEGFPTIYFLKANEKDNPIPFSGDRSLKKLKEFVAQEATIFNVEQEAHQGRVEL